jgi:N-acetylglutamate synthase-like GNAT family acetyltransferase
MALTIRKANNKDIQSLCSLMSELSHHSISSEAMLNRLQFVNESRFDSLFVCEEDDTVLGLLGFRIRENLEEVSRFGEISAVIVNSKDKHKGIGKFMMDYAENLAKDLGCKGTWLVSGFAREQEAHKFYMKLGYQTTGYRFVKLFE